MHVVLKNLKVLGEQEHRPAKKETAMAGFVFSGESVSRRASGKGPCSRKTDILLRHSLPRMEKTCDSLSFSLKGNAIVEELK